MAVRIETQGAVATVVIDRPERKNAVDAQTARDLAEAFRAVEANGEIGAAVLWGAGGTFCAGGDLKAIGSEGSRIRPTGAARFAGGAGRHGAPAS
jgi:Enoyl-CoA hydratase/carnithine racemase